MIRSKQRKTPARNFILVGVFYSNPRRVYLGGFQDWIVPLPGVHCSSLCILNFTAKKDKKRVKMDGFWEKCEKIVREGQKSEKNSSKKLREIFHELEGSNVSLLWQKTDKK